MTQLLSRVRARLSYANLTATLALFIALGGTTYAATSLPRNSVGSAQIRSNAVGASEIRRRAVGSSEIRDRAIGVRDIAASARGSLRGSQGPAGPAGRRAGRHGVSRSDQLRRRRCRRQFADRKSHSRNQRVHRHVRP